MCAQYTLNTSKEALLKKFHVQSTSVADNWEIRPRGFMKTDLAPVIVEKDGEVQVREMAFSLCPSWSKEFPCKWSTYNARMERQNEKDSAETEYIYEIPTWREPFNSGKTCLVPMNAAIESSYFGTHAGNMIQLKEKNDEIFFAVGLWSEWLDKATGEIKETFALITDDPYEFFYECGHDRSVFVIQPESCKDWLVNKSYSSKQRFEFLRESRINLNWDVRVDRQMAKSWQKRAPTDMEVESIKVWKPQG